jgi:hypothetical protein
MGITRTKPRRCLIPRDPGRASRRSFFKTAGALKLGAAAGAFAFNGIGADPVASAAPAEAPSPRRGRTEINVGSRRQLLFDDFFVCTGFWTETDNHPERVPHNIRWSPGRAERSVEPVMRADRPWEDWAGGLTVLKDGGMYRGWYGGLKRPGGGFFVSYAESDDGVTWRKPSLGIIEKAGSKQNNIVFEGADAWQTSGACVFIDPSAKPEERYKMVFSAWETKHTYPFGDFPFALRAGVVRGAFSGDGLHWTQYPEIFFGGYSDTHNAATFDPVLQKYVAYIRWGGSYGALDNGPHPVRSEVRGRSISRMESWDFHEWSPPETNFVADFEDGLDVDFYTSGYSRYDGADYAHFLFPSVFHHWDGIINTQVAVSRDGKNWLRPTREAFVPNGPEGSFDSRMIFVAPGLVPAGNDRLALYYRGDNVPHPPHPGVPDPPEGSAVMATGRVLFKRDRIICIEGNRAAGTFATRPLIFEGRRLVVNVEPTGPNPRLEVEMIGVGIKPAESKVRGKFMEDAPCPGCSLDESLPITTDELDGPVRWKTRAEVGDWAGKPVRLRFRIQSMRIFGFQFM